MLPRTLRRRAILALCFGFAVAGQAGCFSDTRFSDPKFAVSGQPQRINFFTSLNPDCTLKGFATVRVLSAPNHGQLTVVQGSDYSSFPENSQRYVCNTKKTEGVVVTYVSTPGYVGADAATIEAIFPGGGHTTYEYAITVK